jgi:hypothetical protein
MPRYVITVAATAGLAFFVHTTMPQQQEMEISVNGTKESGADHAVFTATSDFVLIRSAAPISTPITIVDFEEYHMRVKVAKAIGAAAALAFVLLVGLAAMNVVNFAIWLPALPALIGLMAMLGAQIERLEGSS